MKKKPWWNKKTTLVSLFVFFFALFTSVVPVGFAAGGTVEAPPGLSASYSEGTWAWNKNSHEMTGSIASTSSGGCNPTYTTAKSTLTLTNTSGANEDISFEYTLSNAGIVNVGGTGNKTSNGTYSFSKSGLAHGATIQVVLTSHQKNDTATTVVLKNFTVVAEVANITTTFSSSAFGSYTVIGKDFSVTIEAGGESQSHQQTNEDEYTLTATPLSGYEFASWKSDGSVVSDANPYVGSLGSDGATVTPYFIPKGIAKFEAGGKYFYDLKDANSAASAASNKVITLKRSGFVPEGTFSISSGVTLFLPTSESDASVKTTKPDTSADAWVKPTEYLRLTLLSGCIINVSGSISIPSLVCRQNGSKETTAPTGPSSTLYMNSGSTINLNSGANLYCWGFLWGSGEVHAKNGSKVYELFQLPSWKGGTAMSEIQDECKASDVKVFPCNSYYVQNVEASLFLYYGATETVYFCSTLSSSSMEQSIVFISNSSGMFRLGSGSYVVKRYDSTTDRLMVDIYGNVTIASFTISVSVTIVFFTTSVKLNTADYVMPINTNMSVHIHSGTTTLNSGQDIGFFPGTELIVDEGATFKISSNTNAYFYSYSDETWGNYLSWSTAMQAIAPVIYTPSNGQAPATGYKDIRTVADYKNANIVVNGTLEVAGYAYTTIAKNATPGSSENGVISSTAGAGIIKMTAPTVPATTVTKQMKSVTPEFVEINAQAPMLINGSEAGGLVQASVANSEYYYSLDASHPGDYTYGTWKRRDLGATEATIHFLSEDGSYEYFVEKPYTGDNFSMPTSNHAGLPESGYSLKAWRDDTDTYFYTAGSQVKITSDFNGRELRAFYGGWYKDYYYPKERSGLDGAYGLYMLPGYETENTINGSIHVEGGDVCLFDSNGKLIINDPLETGPIPVGDWAFLYSSTTYSGRGDDQIYHVVQVVVQKDTGIVQIGEYVYFFGSDYCAYKDGEYWVDSNNPSVPSGQYWFDEYGRMDINLIGVELPTVVEDGHAYYVYEQGTEQEENRLAYGWGLFALDGYLYYALDDGSVAKDTSPKSFLTYYVKKTNGCTIGGSLVEPGTYYFDSDGRMYDASFTIVTNGGNAA